MRECHVCGEIKGLISVGAALLCPVHHIEVMDMVREKQVKGESVSALKEALKIKKEQKGQKTIYVDHEIVSDAMEHWDGSFSGLVNFLLIKFIESKK